MPYVLMGSLAFLFFIVYDINSVTKNYKLLHSGFFAGSILLIAATGGIIFATVSETGLNTGRTIAFGLPALIFFVLLIYTLFFALPFENTYVKTNMPPKTCRTGVYALSRHPGVLWFMGFYLFLWLALTGPLLLFAGILFSLLNLFYIILQDRWTFMKVFPDYSDYKK
ncbi:MAG: hypothetical protein AAGU75_19640, partial [Bacillota bacterium]